MAEHTDSPEPKDFGWVLLELMGHRKRIGKACEEEIAGKMMLRVDVLTADHEEYQTEYYGSSAIYAIRPVAEQVARDAAKNSSVRPVKPADYQPQYHIELDDPEHDDDVY